MALISVWSFSFDFIIRRSLIVELWQESGVVAISDASKISVDDDNWQCDGVVDRVFVHA